jgi:hypothetical protein
MVTIYTARKRLENATFSASNVFMSHVSRSTVMSVERQLSEPPPVTEAIMAVCTGYCLQTVSLISYLMIIFRI